MQAQQVMQLATAQQQLERLEKQELPWLEMRQVPLVMLPVTVQQPLVSLEEQMQTLLPKLQALWLTELEPPLEEELQLTEISAAKASMLEPTL